MTAADIISAEQRYLLQTYARPEFVIERGEGCYLYDSEGRRYLDCVAGIAVNAARRVSRSSPCSAASV